MQAFLILAVNFIWGRLQKVEAVKTVPQMPKAVVHRIGGSLVIQG